MVGDIILSKPIKPVHIVFRGRGLLYQRKKDVITSGVKITNTANSDPDKWQYSGYGIGFDSKGEFTHPDGGYGKNFIIFGADLSNSRHVNNKTKQFLVLGRDFVQKINDTTIYAEKMYSPNFAVDNKTFC